MTAKLTTQTATPTFLAVLLIGTGAGAGCGGDTPSDPRQQALIAVKAYLSENLGVLEDAATKLRAAAPTPDADGWNATADAAAVATMRAEWKRTRVYEKVEGAIAILFPEFDVSSDERYDGFLDSNGPDDDLFDDQNVTGVHAIERILWSDQITASVREFESGLTGYVPAAFPASQQQADDFKNRLCARLVDDIRTARAQFAAATLDDISAFRGVIGSMGEQIEKAEFAGSGAEESRYAQFTLADMRINVGAGADIFAKFEPWLRSKNGTAQIDAVHASFARVEAAYAQLAGDALPPVPATWSPTAPSAADLATPYGMLWTVVHTEADPASSGSLVAGMNQAARTMGIGELPP